MAARAFWRPQYEVPTWYAVFEVPIHLIKKLIYLTNKVTVKDLLLFSICINDKIKISNIEKLIDHISACKIPKFPISGDYLKKYGYETGQALGTKLKSLEKKWIENNFVIDKGAVEKSLGKINQN